MSYNYREAQGYDLKDVLLHLIQTTIEDSAVENVSMWSITGGAEGLDGVRTYAATIELSKEDAQEKRELESYLRLLTVSIGISWKAILLFSVTTPSERLTTSETA